MGDIKVGSSLKQYIINSNVELVAKAKEGNITVSYDYATNGGSSASVLEEEYSYKQSIKYSAVTAEKTGYEFVGWNTDKDATEALTEEILAGTKNITLYAIYKKVETANFYYYDNSTQALENTTCTKYNNQNTCNFSLPEVVSNSIGIDNTAYKGVSIDVSSSDIVTDYSSNNLNYYAVYESTVKSNFYYNNNGTIDKATANGTEVVLSDGSTYSAIFSDVTIPTEVTNSTGENQTTYVGISDKANSMNKVDKATSGNTYYAIYRSEVSQYLNNGTTGTSRKIYRNNFFKNNTTMTTVLSDTTGGTSNLSLSNIDSTKVASGLSSTNEAVNGVSVSEAAKTTTKTFYTTYKENIGVSFVYYDKTTSTQKTTDSVTGTRYYNYDLSKVNNGTIEVPAGVSSSSGIEDGSYQGLSKDKDSATITTNITTENSKYYAVYRGVWTINYTKDNTSVSSISSTTASCNNNQVTDGNSYKQIGENCTGRILPTITLNTGYENAIWTDLTDNKTYSSGGTYNIVGSRNLKASGTIKTYKVTYDCTTNGGTCSISPNPKDVNYGNSADITQTAEKEGYDFLGWNTNKTATSGLSTAPKVTSNITLYAIFKKVESATFYYYGNSGISNKSVSCTIYNNDASCLTIPTEVTNSTGENQTTYVGISDKANSMNKVDKATSGNTYYAIYRSEVSQYLNNGTTGTSRKIYRNNFFKNNTTMTTVLSDTTGGTSNLSLSNIDSTKVASGLSSTNEAVNGVSVSEAAKTTTKTFYTTYKENIGVSFVYYDKTTSTQKTTDSVTGTRYYNYDLSKVNNGTIEVPAGVSSSSGIEDGSYQGLSKDKDSATITTNITTENSKYYAVYRGVWTINYTKDNTSVSSISSTTASCNNNQVTDGNSYKQIGENCTGRILPTITLNTGYENAIWTDLTDNKTYSSGGTYNIVGSRNLKASGTIKTYKVTYDCTTNGGTCSISPNPKDVNYGNSADITQTAEKEGYDFLGWNTNKTATSGLSTAPKVTSNITLYAIFKKSTSISLSSKTATYTGSPIVANEAVVLDGPSNPTITYKYYSDSSCKTALSGAPTNV